MPDSGAVGRPATAANPVHHGHDAHARPPRSRRHVILRWVLLVLGPLALIVGSLEWYLNGGRYVSTDNAYVRADMVNIATDVSGIVARTLVQETSRSPPDRCCSASTTSPSASRLPRPRPSCARCATISR